MVWNFRQAAYGLPIGDWDDDLNSDQMKMEIVEGFLTCAERDPMRRNEASKMLIVSAQKMVLRSAERNGNI